MVVAPAAASVWVHLLHGTPAAPAQAMAIACQTAGLTHHPVLTPCCHPPHLPSPPPCCSWCAVLCDWARLRPPLLQQQQAAGGHCGYPGLHAPHLPLRALADQAQPAPRADQQVRRQGRTVGGRSSSRRRSSSCVMVAAAHDEQLLTIAASVSTCARAPRPTPLDRTAAASKPHPRRQPCVHPPFAASVPVTGPHHQLSTQPIP